MQHGRHGGVPCSYGVASSAPYALPGEAGSQLHIPAWRVGRPGLGGPVLSRYAAPVATHALVRVMPHIHAQPTARFSCCAKEPCQPWRRWFCLLTSRTTWRLMASIALRPARTVHVCQLGVGVARLNDMWLTCTICNGQKEAAAGCRGLSCWYGTMTKAMTTRTLVYR